MADKDIKKVIIPPANLLSVNVDSTTGKSQYFVRYRIVSEDKTRQSAWSPIHNVEARTISTIIGSTTITTNVFSNGDRVTLTWTAPDSLKTVAFDIYTKWYLANGNVLSDYTYSGTSTSSSFNISIPTSAASVQFWIQVSTFPKLKSEAAKLAETGLSSTKYKISGGSIA